MKNQSLIAIGLCVTAISGCSEETNETTSPEEVHVSRYSLPSQTGAEWVRATENDRLWLMNEFVKSSKPGAGLRAAEEMKTCMDEVFKSIELRAQPIKDTAIGCATLLLSDKE